MVLNSDMLARRQDARFAQEVSMATRQVVEGAIKAGLTPDTADSLEALADVFHSTQEAARGQSEAVLDRAVADINRNPQARRQYQGPHDEVKDQDMLVYPKGYHPVLHTEKPVGQVVLHHAAEAAYVDPDSLPYSSGINQLEWYLHGAAEAARHGRSGAAEALTAKAHEALGHLVSVEADPVPILVGHTVKEDQRFKELKLVSGGRFDPRRPLSNPVSVVFTRDKDGQRTSEYREAPRFTIAVMENLPPHLDIGA